MTTVTRRLEFDYGHRVLGHSGKCRHLHGHRATVEVMVKAGLDRLGMVVDFAVIKQRLGGWIDEFLDHNLILHPADPLVKLLLNMTPEQVADPDGIFGGKVPFFLGPIDNPSDDGRHNPTAENLARMIYDVASNLLPTFKIVSVTFYETPNCSATYTGGD